MNMNQNYNVKYHIGPDGFRQIENEWNVIFNSLSRKKFYCHYKWYKCYMEALHPSEETIYFFVVFRGDLPVAVFPLKKAVNIILGLRIKTWETIFHNHIVFTDIICNAENNHQDILIFFIKYLSGTKGFNYHALIIHNALEQSSILHLLKQNEYSLNIVKRIRQCSYIHIDNLKKYADTLKSKNLRKKLRRLEKLGYVQFSRVDDKENIVTGLDQFLEVESSGWKGEAGSAIKCHEELVQFYRCLVNEFSDIGRCQIYLLTVDQKCIAADFSILDEDTIYSLKIGYREDYARYSPGIICWTDFLQMVSQYKNINYVNFITKQEWHGLRNVKNANVNNIYVFSLSTRGILFFLLEKSKQLLKQLKSGLRRP